MTPRTEAKPRWVLHVKGADGEEVEAGRFVTDFAALRFVENYGITEWRLKGPGGKFVSPES